MRLNVVKKNCAVLALAWTMVVFGFGIKDALHLKDTIDEMARAEARAHFNKDQAVRLWASKFGGFYVPVSEKNPPNPALSHVAERDLVTQNGKQLTLMSSAYMTRQIMADYSERHGIKANITSMKPLRKESAPDEWEKTALQAFALGESEVLNQSKIDNTSYLRLMRPLRIEEGCLKCHGTQGYTEGDIVGGLSVSVPMTPYKEMRRKEMSAKFISLTVIWGLGLIGLWISSRMLAARMHALEKAEKSLRMSQETYRALVDSSQTGIYVSQNGKIVFANAEFARLHGFELDAVIGKESLSFIHPDDRAMVAERTRKRYCKESLSDEYQVRCLTPRGKTIFVQRRNTLTTYNGQAAILGNEINITRRIVADAELANAERQLQRLADGLIELHETEREHFARQIHENFAQCLTAIKLQVECVLNDPNAGEDARDALQPITHDIRQTLAEIRKVARHFRPIGLEQVGIIKTIDWLCRQFAATCPFLQITKRIRIEEHDIPDALKIIIFRVMEQVLHTVSNQPDAAVETGLELVSDRILFYLRTDVDAVKLNFYRGKGFLPGELALIALKRRIEMFGGSFLFSSFSRNDTWLVASWKIFSQYRPDQPPHKKPPLSK